MASRESVAPGQAGQLDINLHRFPKPESIDSARRVRGRVGKDIFLRIDYKRQVEKQDRDRGGRGWRAGEHDAAEEEGCPSQTLGIFTHSLLSQSMNGLLRVVTSLKG